MHRSGTSLTARILDLLGVDLGPSETIIPPVEGDNPAGFWEQWPLISLNIQILEILGGSWWQPPQMKPGWQHDPELAPLRRDAARLLDKWFKEAPLWGWKDPRNSLTLPFWQEIVPEMRYVLCLRDPVAVASSLSQRNPRKCPWLKCFALWHRYNGAALEHTDGARRLVVFFEDCFDDIGLQADRLARFIGREPGEVSGDVKAEINRFFDRGLLHHEASGRDSIGADPTSTEALAAYRSLRSRFASDDDLLNSGRLSGTAGHD